MKFNKEDEASFFKVLLTDSDNLLLPSAFAKKYLEKGDNKKQNIVLQTESGVEWRAKYVRIKDRYYFTGGWIKFLKENHLQFGDFLVFWLRSHHPNPVFHVFIYSPTGCLKNETSCRFSGNFGLVQPTVVETENINDDESLEKVHRWLTRVIKKSNIRRMNISNRFVKAARINFYSTLRLKNKKGKIWEVKLSKCRGGRGRVRIPFMTTGLLKFMKDNKVQIGDMCKFKHVKGNMLRVLVLKKKKKLY